MDQKSVNTLEFHKVRSNLAAYTRFSAGEALARELQPTTDLFEARQWQAETAEAVKLFQSHTDIRIGSAHDVRRPADNATRGFVLGTENLQQIASTIVAARNLRRQLLKVEEDAPYLAEIASLIEECPGVVSAVNQTIDERGEVLDSASAKLAKLRVDQRLVHGRIQDKLQRLLNSSQSQYLQESIITQRNGRYVVPVRIDSKGHVKGIVHDQSGSGATLWIEPLNTVDLNNEMRSLLIQEQEEINRILRELSALIGEHADSIKRVVERMAELDLIFARANYAMALNAIQPEFVEWRHFEEPHPPKHANEREKWTPPPRNLHPGSTLWIQGARHPLLNQGEVVPTDLTVPEEVFTVLITGPNTGGKTVSLKTTGLMVLMAQSGLHLPAIDAKLTIFDNVFADIGDEQSIEQSLSTFSAHMTNIVRILSLVDEKSLVLLDELGSGTDPTEGAALAQSTVGYLRDKGATTFVATHYPELKVYASQTEGATNASMLFDIETLSPTYELSIGIPGRSNAFAIARRLGLDETILDDAMRLVGSENHETEEMLESIHTLREKMESEEAATRIAMRDAVAIRDRLQKRLTEIEKDRERILVQTRQQADAEIEAVREEMRRVRRKVRDAGSVNQLKKIGQELDVVAEEQVVAIAPAVKMRSTEPETRTEKQKRRELQVGDTVLIKTLDTRGEVVELGKKDVLVAVGRMQMRAKFNDLEFKGRETAAPESDFVPMATSPGLELDIRGKRVEDGIEELERYLDSAFLAHLPWVRIIHGKGTGRLRDSVRQLLRTNSFVTSFEEGKDGEGGAGVTVAKIVEHK